MAQPSAVDIQKLISAMSDLHLPLDKTQFSGRTEFQSLDKEVRKLQGMCAVLKHLPNTDPDITAIYAEAKSLQRGVKQQLQNRIHLNNVG